MSPNSPRSSGILIASLVLNVFLVGAMAGGAYRWATLRLATTPIAAHPRGLRAAAVELSEARRLQLREALQHTRRANRPVILSAQAGRRDVVNALQAQPFDAAALDAALARTRKADAALRVEIENTISQFAADLKPEERAELAGAMQGRRGLGPSTHGKALGTGDVSSSAEAVSQLPGPSSATSSPHP